MAVVTYTLCSCNSEAGGADLYPNEHIRQANNNKYGNDNRPCLIIVVAADIVVDREVGAQHCPQELGGGEEDVSVEQAPNPTPRLLIGQGPLGTVLCQQNLAINQINMYVHM